MTFWTPLIGTESSWWRRTVDDIDTITVTFRVGQTAAVVEFSGRLGTVLPSRDVEPYALRVAERLTGLTYGKK